MNQPPTFPEQAEHVTSEGRLTRTHLIAVSKLLVQSGELTPYGASLLLDALDQSQVRS